ncbi:MAG: GGDEF domain-containing protein [Dehalococcoidia bacterium]|nr:GGDEF domain-containing protein [Dehalococcoidia bacterium]
MPEERYSFVSRARRRYYILLAVIAIFVVGQAAYIIADHIVGFGASADKAVQFSAVGIRVLLFVVLVLMLRRDLQYVDDTIHDLALKDDLTDLWNRRYFLDRLDQEMSRSRRSGSAMALIMADADGLKEINDRHGHAAGDRLLKSIANSLKSRARPYDVVARVGGDEFAILMPGVGKDELQNIWPRFMTPLADDFGINDGPPWSTATISVGAAVYPDDGHTQEALLASADQEMYKAKISNKSRLAELID